MRTLLALTGWICIGVAAVLSAERPAPPAVPIEKLVEQLASRNYREREAASKMLEARGEAALEPMRKAANTTKDPEARRRLQVLIANLERTVTLSPKRVTLKAQNQPIGNVVENLAKLTGYQIQFQGGNRNQPVNLDFENHPFWEVLDRICLVGGLTVQHNEGSGFQLYQNDAIWPYVCYQGPFKLTASCFYYNRTITLGGLPRNPAQQQARNESLQFSFNIMSEPKLPLMQAQPAKLIEAVDDRGNSLMLPMAGNVETVYYGHNGYRTHNYASQVQLAPPAKDARFVKVLRGSIPVTLLAEQKPEIVIDEILKVKNKKFTGNETEIQIDEVKDNKTSFSIKMTVRNNAKNANQDYSWTNSVHQRLELVDAKGNKYHSHGYNWENSSPANISATFMFGTNGNAALGPPARLVYNQWSMMQHQIEFEFRDLPLP